MINLREILLAGHAARQAVKNASETAKAGSLRIGNAGIKVGEQVYGTCHRVSLARLLGLQTEPNLASKIMFMAGERNEDSWIDVLTAAGWEVDRTTVVEGTNSFGRKIMGHPDIVLKRDGKAVLGLELKGIYGASTLESVLKGMPKNENLIQMAAYSWLVGVPFALCYTLPSWTKVGSTQHKPLYKIFYTEWRDGVLWYRDEASPSWYKTVITQDGIKDYYDLIDAMPIQKDLGNRPTANYVDGTRHKYGPDAVCNFCSYKSACARYDQTRDYDKWVDDASNTEPEE